MKTLKLILILLFAFIYANVKAQSSTFTALNLPNVTAPSPAAQNFNRYGEIPIDYSTGVPNISVPLYTVKSRQLSVPLSISYHASGIKVSDKSSPIGLGWVLNAGGQVTITRLGLDGAAPPWTTTAAFDAAINTAEVAGYDALVDLGNLIYYYANDFGWQSARYNYQLPNGESGVFRYDFTTGNLIRIPYSPVKFGTSGSGYVITDEKGISYTYGQPSVYAEEDNTTFDLHSIISADKTDTIRFVYKTNENVYTCPSYTTILSLCGSYYNSGEPNALDIQGVQTIGNNYSNGGTTGERLLDSIITSNTVVKVTVANDREDMDYADGKYRITNLSVYNRSGGQLIKSYSFTQTYFGTSGDNNQRLRLDSLTVRGNDTARVEKYHFGYQSLVLPPYVENLPPTGLFSDDYYGYFSGHSGAYSDIPYQFTPDSLIIYPVVYQPVSGTYSTNRSPDTSYAKACMLTKIDYPTGGTTYFSFESNYSQHAYNYGSGDIAGFVGGFRIKRISNYTAAGVAADYKAYAYGDGVTRTITSDLYTYYQRNVADVVGSIYEFNTVYSSQVLTSSPMMPLICDHGPPVFYGSVTEYDGDASGNVGKTLYTYQQPPATYWSNPSLEDQAWYQDAYEMDMGNYTPQLLSKTVYKNVSGTYVPVKATVNTWTAFLADSTYHMGMHMNATNWVGGDINNDRNMDSGGWNPIYYGSGGFPSYESLGSDAGYGCYYYLVHDIMATQQVSKVTQTVEYDYNPGDSTKYVANTTNYTYGSFSGYTLGSPVHDEPTQKTVSASTGDTYITTMAYPQDFYSAAPYSTMLSENILSPVIQQANYKNSTGNFLNSVTTNYNAFTSTIIEPQTVQSQQGAGSAETRITYGAYDNTANVAQVSKTNGPQVSYIWGYNQAYPVAQVTNAPLNDVFYDSFEQNDGTFISSVKEDCKTGHYSAASGTIQYLTGLDNGTYTLSYWSKPSTTWVFNTSNVSVSGGAYTIYLSGVQVDDVRFYPVGAQMVTYTFDPGIGETSMTDAKGVITYYEYDNFARLKLIRDQGKNIVKSYCYNYQGENVGCFVAGAAPPTPIYVRLEQSSYTDTGLVPDGGGGYEDNVGATLTIKFYSNAACTVPYTLTASTVVPLTITEEYYDDMLGSTSYTTTTYNYTVSSGVSSYSLGANGLTESYTYFDEYENFWSDWYSWDYELVQPGTYAYTVL